MPSLAHREAITYVITSNTLTKVLPTRMGIFSNQKISTISSTVRNTAVPVRMCDSVSTNQAEVSICERV